MVTWVQVPQFENSRNVIRLPVASTLKIAAKPEVESTRRRLLFCELLKRQGMRTVAAGSHLGPSR